MLFVYKTLKISISIMAVLTIILGGIYPLAVFLIGQTFFSFKANGSLLFNPKNQTVIGSSLIGQNFQSPLYFHPRPSYAGPNGYDAIRSGASNLPQTSTKLIGAVEQRAEQYRQFNLVPLDVYIPIDAVTASGSGLDPHISISNALLQIPRIAKARNISEEKVARLVQQQTTREAFGILGQPHINVLMLNLSLDQCQYEKVE
jgi:K+-transporting ATPase ATPase C chain